MLCDCKIMGIFVCRMVSYVPLNAEKCIQNLKEISKFYFDVIQRKCLHYLSVHVPCLFCLKLIKWKVKGVPQ